MRNVIKGRETLLHAWANFLSRVATWSFWGTLTLRGAHSRERLMAEFPRYIRRLEQRAGAAVKWFIVVERGRSFGRWHLHFLLACDRLRGDGIRESWSLGKSDVHKYDSAKGALYYIAKFVDDPEATHDLDPRLGREDTIDRCKKGHPDTRRGATK
jgi:hypothetical protein